MSSSVTASAMVVIDAFAQLERIAMATQLGSDAGGKLVALDGTADEVVVCPGSSARARTALLVAIVGHEDDRQAAGMVDGADLRGQTAADRNRPGSC